MYVPTNVSQEDKTAEIDVKIANGTREGKVTYATRTLKNVSPDLSDANAYGVGQGWAAFAKKNSGVTDAEAITMVKTYQIVDDD